MRLFYLLKLFSYKVIKKIVLPDFLTINNITIKSEPSLNDNRERKVKDASNIVHIPMPSLICGEKRFSIFLPKFINFCLKYSTNLSFKDFKESSLLNIKLTFEVFNDNFMTKLVK